MTTDQPSAAAVPSLVIRTDTVVFVRPLLTWYVARRSTPTPGPGLPDGPTEGVAVWLGPAAGEPERSPAGAVAVPTRGAAPNWSEPDGPPAAVGVLAAPVGKN